MDDDFRGRANEQLARLLAHWRIVEFWIKRGEQISKDAIIPAINELRYASRQLFNAQRLFDKSVLSNGDKSVITKRLTIAEQYLLNAEHDVCDAITVYFDNEITALDREYGPASITMIYNEYPLLRNRIRDCQTLIAEAREDYSKRHTNYLELRTNHFPHLIEANQRLLEAEVGAKEQKAGFERQLKIARSKIRFLEWFGLIAGGASVIAVPLSIYLWLWAKEDFCDAYRTTVIGHVCALGPHKAPNAVSTPSAGQKP